ncbi:MAG: HlyD family type I secretion periplasmic adaptor subunit, partial [Pseudomonadota bacterium]
VKAGDTLLSLDETAAEANERELYIRQARLEAMEARLLAQYRQDDAIRFPDQVLEMRSNTEIATILDSQKLAFDVASRARENDVSLLERNIDALSIRARGYEVQLVSHRQQLAILEEEFEDKQSLLTKGLIRRSEMNVLERAKIEATGQIGRLEAEVDEIDQMVLKYQTQIQKAVSQYSQSALDDLQAVQAELDSIREQSRKARNVLERAEVTAPVSGTVVRMHYHTSGGVIESGNPILEILPSDAPLIVEILVARNDIDDIALEQEAIVRLSALNQRTTPVLKGKLIYISADAVTSTTDGTAREVYVARVNLSPEEMHRAEGFVPTPGMPAEVMIQTAERTFVQYLVKPIKDSMGRAFREQ